MSPKNPNNGNHQSMENVFLGKIRNFVLDNLNCEDFSLERLSNEIGYSRSQIHRKLKKITGKPLSQFIREIRLEEALKLLQQRVGTVSEVSFRVGFSSPVYFSKCFSDYYGKTPGEVLKEGASTKLKPVRISSKSKKKYLVFYSLGIIPVVAVILLLFINFGSSVPVIKKKAAIINEDGTRSNQKIYTDDNIHKVLIGLFEQEPESDTLNSWMEWGFLLGIVEELSQFTYVMPFRSASLSIQINIDRAQSNKCEYFLLGSYLSGDTIHIKTSLHDANTGEVVLRREYWGPDFFSIIDSVSLQTRIDIGIPRALIESYPDLEFSSLSTESTEAYKYYLMNMWSGIFSRGNFVNAKTAIELDPTFGLASWKYAFRCHQFNEQLSNRSARKYINHSISNMRNLPPVWRYQIQALKYNIEGDYKSWLKYLEMVYIMMPARPEIIEDLIRAYNYHGMYREARILIRRLIKIDPDNLEYKRDLASNYLESDRTSKGLRYINMLIRKAPEGTRRLHLLKGKFLIRMGRYDEAREAINTELLVNRMPELVEAFITHIDYVTGPEFYPEYLKKFCGTYYNERNESSYSYYIDNEILWKRQSYRPPKPAYIISDRSITTDGFFIDKFIFNDKGDIIQRVNESPGYSTQVSWKEDSLIIIARQQLDQGNLGDALGTFRKAYSRNPDHYYLENYVKHLEFILSADYKSSIQSISNCIGKYKESIEIARILYEDGRMNYAEGFYTEIYEENGQFIRKNYGGLEHIILPLSENKFITKGIDDHYLEFVRENNKVVGMKLVLYNGSSFYLERLSD